MKNHTFHLKIFGFSDAFWIQVGRDSSAGAVFADAFCGDFEALPKKPEAGGTETV